MVRSQNPYQSEPYAMKLHAHKNYAKKGYGMHIIWKVEKIVLTTIKYFLFYSVSVEKHMFRHV